MKINIPKLKSLIERATMHNSIEYLQLVISGSRITASMVSSKRDIAMMLDEKNTLISGVGEYEIILNFAEPYVRVLPYLKNLSEIKVDFECNEKFLILKPELGIFKIPLCHSNSIQNNLLYKSPQDDFEYFSQVRVGKHILKILESLIKIDKKFGKFYVEVASSKMFFWVGDATNQFAPKFTIEICEVEYQDLLLCFQLKNIINLKKSAHVGSMFKFAYIPETEGGLITMSDANSGVMYMLLNREA